MQPIKTTPKDFFLNLGVIVTLYFSVISLINLVFAIINKYFPDAASYNFFEEGTIRWTISSLVILFPIFLFLSKLVNKDTSLVPEKKNLWIRKWSTYLTLFLTGATIAVDLIILLNFLLGGEITIRFILKVATVLLVALFVFMYYLHDLKRTDFHGDSKIKFMAWKASALVLIAIIGGFLSVGSPSEERERRLDNEREMSLSIIQGQVLNYWQKKKELPPNLEALQDPISSVMIPNDPETNQPFEYRPTGPLAFEICATFGTDSRDRDAAAPSRAYLMENGLSTVFPHGEGRTCFERTIDPELHAVPVR